MIRAQSLALQCARESARSRAFGKAGGKACAPCQILRCCGGSSTRQAFVDGGGRRAQPAEGGAGNRYHTAARSLHWNEAVNSDTGGMIYEGADERGTVPQTAEALVERLKGLGRKGGPRAAGEALRLLEDGRKEGIKDARAYNAVFRCLSAVKKNVAMTELMEQMKGDGLEPDVDTYNYVIYGHATGKDVAAAVRTYDDMLANGLTADDKTLSNMVIAHSWESTKDMTRTFEELRAKDLEPSRASYHSMISALRRDENWQAVRILMHAMIEEGRAPNDPAFAVGFMTARKLGDPDFAKLLLETRGRAGLPLRHDFFVNVMVTLAEAGRPKEVLVLWRQLVCVQGLGSVDIKPETYALTIRSATKLRAWEEVETILGMMEARSMPIDDNLYLAVMGPRSLLRDKSDVERVLKFVGELERRSGATMAPALQLQLAVVCTSAKMYERATPLFEVAQNAEVRISGYRKQALVQNLVGLGRHEAVRAAWSESTSKDRKEYIGSMYLLFMTAAEKLGDVDWALRLHQTCLKEGKKPSRWFHPIAVKMLAEAGRLREAADIAETLRASTHHKLPPESYNILCRCCMEEDDKELVVQIVQEMRRGKGALYLPPPGALGFVVAAFIDQRRSSEILKLFDRMRAQNFQPNGDVYALLAEAAVEAKHRTKAVEFVAEAKKRGVEASATAVAFTGGGVFARGVSNASGAPAGARESTPVNEDRSLSG